MAFRTYGFTALVVFILPAVSLLVGPDVKPKIAPSTSLVSLSEKELSEVEISSHANLIKALHTSEEHVQKRKNFTCSNGRHYGKLPVLLSVGPEGVWCPVPKVATSSIFFTIRGKAGTFEDRICRYDCHDHRLKNMYDLVKNGHRGQVCHLLGGKKSWVVIRNPWDRAQSAYFDKVLDQKVGDKIIVPGHGDNPTFMEYLEFVATLDPNDEAAWNPHTKPFSMSCHLTGPNPFHYDRVIRLEDGLENKVVGALKWSGLKNVTKFLYGNSAKTKVTREEFYTNNGGQAAIDLVSKIYADDISFGKYTYEI